MASLFLLPTTYESMVKKRRFRLLQKFNRPSLMGGSALSELRLIVKPISAEPSFAGLLSLTVSPSMEMYSSALTKTTDARSFMERYVSLGLTFVDKPYLRVRP